MKLNDILSVIIFPRCCGKTPNVKAFYVPMTLIRGIPFLQLLAGSNKRTDSANNSKQIQHYKGMERVRAQSEVRQKIKNNIDH